MTKPTLPKNFCVAPFIQITTHPSGSFSPCPYLGGTTWNDDSGSILAKWQSQDIESLRKSFLTDQKSPICQRCWNEENSNKRSLRLRMLDPTSMHSDYGLLQDTDRLHDILESIQDGSYIKSPKIISIKNGNVCNAKCRSCHPEDSTPWIQDVKKLHQINGTKDFSFTRKNSYKLDVKEINWMDHQIEDLRSLMQDTWRLELFGGEPFYNKKVRRLLENIINDGHSEHISLYINTNGSVDFTAMIPEIYRFHDIDIGVSIDAIPQHFSYVRHPLEFDSIERNIKSWIEYFEKQGTPFKIQSISTVSLLNIFYLPELRLVIQDLLGQSPFWNILAFPRRLNVQTLPSAMKDIVTAKLIQHQGFDDIVHFMNAKESDDKDLADFFQIRDDLDSIRHESFADTFGEFAGILNQYVPDRPKIKIFLGDLSQAWPGLYLESQASKHGSEFCYRLTDLGDDLVLVTEPDRVQHELRMKNLPTGHYFTGVTEWQDLNKLKTLLANCDKVYYCPPKFWSDGPESFSTLLPPRGWSRVVTEELLQNVVDYVTINPNN
jgi:MoaA/NifB/PqqE/SkfB family radical SAM enzyme